MSAEVISPLAALHCCHGDTVRTVVLNEGNAAVMIMVVVIAIHRTGIELVVLSQITSLATLLFL